MKSQEIYTKFNLDFQAFYNDFYDEISKLYSNGEVLNEPMPKLKKSNLQEVLSILNSCFMRAKEENRNEYWMSAYLAVHVATRQILENGNKRLSLLVLCFFLEQYGLRLVLEKSYYAETIKHFIEDLIIANGDKDAYRDKFVNAFELEIKNNSLNQEKDTSIIIWIKNLFPF